MNAKALGFDLYALAHPRSNEDLIVLAQEARDEMRRINAYIEEIFEDCSCPTE